MPNLWFSKSLAKIHLVVHYSSSLCPPCFLLSLSVLHSICSPRSDRLQAIGADKNGMWRWRELTRGPGQTGHVQPSMVISKQQCAALLESYSGSLMHNYPWKRLSCRLPGRDTIHFLYQGWRQAANSFHVFHYVRYVREKQTEGGSQVSWNMTGGCCDTCSDLQGASTSVVYHRKRLRFEALNSRQANFEFFTPQMFSFTHMNFEVC